VGDVVLIADDEEDIIRFVEINLRLEGLDVITARDGEEALHQALNQRPSLLLLDAMMPRMDGYEVCAKLRADERTFQMPIIMLTAKSLEADRALARSVGADDIIIKPFDPTELVEKVKALLMGGLRSTPAAAEPWSPGPPTTWPEPGSSGEPWLGGDGGGSSPEGGTWPGGTGGGGGGAAPWPGSETPPGGGGAQWPGGETSPEGGGAPWPGGETSPGAGGAPWPGGETQRGGGEPWPGGGGSPGGGSPWSDGGGTGVWPDGTPGSGDGDPWPGGGSPGAGGAQPGRGGAQPGTGEADDPRWPDEDDRDPWSPGSGGRWPSG
jgi:CheY-like chemotaxis protein